MFDLDCKFKAHIYVISETHKQHEIKLLVFIWENGLYQISVVTSKLTFIPMVIIIFILTAWT